jgi:hypothetical protein
MGITDTFSYRTQGKFELEAASLLRGELPAAAVEYVAGQVKVEAAARWATVQPDHAYAAEVARRHG